MKNKNIFSNIFFLLLSVLLFCLSQPSLIFEDGCSFIAWFAYIPVFVLLEKVSLKKSFIYGALYGFLSYSLLCWWLSAFGILAVLFVAFLFSLYNSFVFFLIVWSRKIFPSKLADFFWIFRAFPFLCMEFLRTKGILAFSYGIIGYSQWKVPAFLKFASFFGVWGVSFLIVLFGSLSAKIIFEHAVRENLKKLTGFFSILLAIFAYWEISSLVVKKTSSGRIPVVLVQNASSAKSSSIDDFINDFSLLKKLTEDALASHPETELVVWPETAIVPDILRHLENSKDSKRKELSGNLVSYFKNSKRSFLIGNNHSDGNGIHNSALYFSPESQSVEAYDKIKLVPFTEYWPRFLEFKFLDGVKASLNCEDFVPGDEVKSFRLKNFEFSVPICFEDSFSPLMRKMKDSGADFFVNISDDAWAKSEAARKMHLSMSAFRCAEYAAPMIRSTIDGKTCILDAGGKVVSEIDSASDGYLFGEVEIFDSSRTLYFVIGDSLVFGLCVLVFVFLLILSVRFVKVEVYGRR